MESMLEHKVFKRWDKAILDKHKKDMNPPKGYQSASSVCCQVQW